MAVEVLVPRLDWSMEEGTFVEWKKGDGEAVKRGDTLFVLESDKASMDLPSPVEGVVTSVEVSIGDRVEAGTVLVGLDTGSGAEASAADRTSAIAIKFAPEVKTVHRLNRLTGKSEQLPLDSGILRITLPGGTGDLFKINDGAFPR